MSEKATLKKIQRWEHEAVIECHKQRMQQKPGIMKKRGHWLNIPSAFSNIAPG